MLKCHQSKTIKKNIHLSNSSDYSISKKDSNMCLVHVPHDTSQFSIEIVRIGSKNYNERTNIKIMMARVCFAIRSCEVIFPAYIHFSIHPQQIYIYIYICPENTLTKVFFSEIKIAINFFKVFLKKFKPEINQIQQGYK